MVCVGVLFVIGVYLVGGVKLNGPEPDEVPDVPLPTFVVPTLVEVLLYPPPPPPHPDTSIEKAINVKQSNRWLELTLAKFIFFMVGALLRINLKG